MDASSLFKAVNLHTFSRVGRDFVRAIEEPVTLHIHHFRPGHHTPCISLSRSWQHFVELRMRWAHLWLHWNQIAAAEQLFLIASAVLQFTAFLSQVNVSAVVLISKFSDPSIGVVFIWKKWYCCRKCSWPVHKCFLYSFIWTSQLK